MDSGARPGNRLRPTILSSPASILDCFSAAAVSMPRMGSPCSMACGMPPAACISRMMASAASTSSAVRRATVASPPKGSTQRVVPASFWRMSWVLRATFAVSSVGSAMASSNELVCRLCVPPQTAAKASMAVRPTLFKGSCSVNVQPLVWQWVRSMEERGLVGLKPAIQRAHKRRPARSLATSDMTSMPMPQKKLSRGAKSSTSSPASTPALT